MDEKGHRHRDLGSLKHKADDEEKRDKRRTSQLRPLPL